MKIAVLIRNYKRSAGGAERYCVELTERLSANHDVHVFTQNYENNPLSKITFHKILQLSEKPRFINQLLFSRLTKNATSGKFDIVHSHERVSHADIYTFHVQCFRTLWSNIKGFRKLIRWLNTLLSPRKLCYLWLESQQMQVLPRRRFISVSEYLSRNILECYPKISNITIAHPGISTNVNKSVENNNNKFSNLKESLSIPNSSFILLFVANNFKKKGLPKIIESLEMLSNEKLHLVIAGNGNSKKIKIPNSISSNIHYLGVIKNITLLYPQADALLHPTLADTYGMAALEAMAAGLPVVISNKEFCGLSEHLNENQAVLLENPRDAIELAKKIDLLYKNTEYRDRIAKNGFEKSKTISWGNTLSKTLRVYNSIANSPR